MNRIILSRKYGWYLARINASIEIFANIVATSFKIIKKYNLQPGRYIKIGSFNKIGSKIENFDKFILLPFFNEFIDNAWLLQDVIRSITYSTYRYVDKDYINMIIKLMNTFYQEQKNKRGFVIKEIFELDTQETSQMDIAMPESWLNENSVDLGETVLLRNDEPSPIIL
ncbi:MAG: hypothetical protein ACFFE5_11135 [Candidatus Thorarchaeota archaeon]